MNVIGLTISIPRRGPKHMITLIVALVVRSRCFNCGTGLLKFLSRNVRDDANGSWVTYRRFLHVHWLCPERQDVGKVVSDVVSGDVPAHIVGIALTRDSALTTSWCSKHRRAALSLTIPSSSFHLSPLTGKLSHLSRCHFLFLFSFSHLHR